MGKGLIFSDQATLFGHREIIGYGDNGFYLKEINKDVANKIIKNYHYSKKVQNNSFIHLGVFIGGKMLGVLQYGYAMNPASCSSLVPGTQIDEHLELSRLWLDEAADRNSESKAVSYSLKYIRNKYPKIKWIQSFADERCGRFGIVYQACSFGFYGKHVSNFYESDDGEVFHDQILTFHEHVGSHTYNRAIKAKNEGRLHKKSYRQFRYLFFLDKRAKKNCTLEEKPYPKHYKGD